MKRILILITDKHQHNASFTIYKRVFLCAFDIYIQFTSRSSHCHITFPIFTFPLMTPHPFSPPPRHFTHQPLHTPLLHPPRSLCMNTHISLDWIIEPNPLSTPESITNEDENSPTNNSNTNPSHHHYKSFQVIRPPI